MHAYCLGQNTVVALFSGALMFRMQSSGSLNCSVHAKYSGSLVLCRVVVALFCTEQW